jgi:hypothetical protein
MTRSILASMTILFCVSSAVAQVDTESESDPAELSYAERFNQVFGVEDACFEHNIVETMKALDDRFIYLETKGPAQHYLLAMEGSCPGLRGDIVIGLQQPTSPRVCPHDRAVIVYSRVARERRAGCFIRDIVEV